jgi:hypothetical protein
MLPDPPGRSRGGLWPWRAWAWPCWSWQSGSVVARGRGYTAPPPFPDPEAPGLTNPLLLEGDTPLGQLIQHFQEEFSELVIEFYDLVLDRPHFAAGAHGKLYRGSHRRVGRVTPIAAKEIPVTGLSYQE